MQRDEWVRMSFTERLIGKALVAVFVATVVFIAGLTWRNHEDIAAIRSDIAVIKVQVGPLAKLGG